MRIWPLDHSNGRSLPISSPAENQDGLRQQAHDHYFVVKVVIRKSMHRPADQRLLTFQNSNRWCIFPRQPGEARNLRMHHSIRYQDFFPLTVVDQGFDLAQFQGLLVFIRPPMMRIDATSPSAISWYTVAEELLRLEAQSSLCFVSTNTPAG